MKQPVEYSTLSKILTVGICVILWLGLFFTRDIPGKFWMILTVTFLLILFALFYSPVSVSADDSRLIISRRLRKKYLPYNEILSIGPYQPVWYAGSRICASGGFGGYWGWMHDPNIGRFFAYFGKSSECFLVKMKNGSQYLIGCKDPEAILSLVSGRIGGKNSMKEIKFIK